MRTSIEDAPTASTGFDLIFQTRNADAHSIYTNHEQAIRRIMREAKERIKNLVTLADYPTKP